MNLKTVMPYASIVFGTLILLVGVALVVMYVLEAIIRRLGDPDQSLLFWYLPVLFIGIFGIVTGSSMAMAGRRRLKDILN